MRNLLLACLTACCVALPAQAANLVVNGDFEAGNSDFTSSYNYSPGSNSAESQYTVRSNPFPWNGAFTSVGDHTTGSGLMMVANGAPTPGSIVWQSSPITITGSTEYFFEAYVMNVCCASPFPGNTPPNLQFSISLNGGALQSLATLSVPLDPAGIWHGLSTNFNSGTATTASLYLINANSNILGNDFAIDDISLSTSSIVNPPAVPEPAAWAMMITGFGLAGSALRRKRSRPALA